MTLESAPGKRELRRKLGSVPQTLTAAEIKAYSIAARELLRGQDAWRAAKSVLFYAALPREIDLWPLLEEGLRQGKAIALPRFVAEAGAYQAFHIADARRDCARGKFGIIEPLGSCPPLPLKQLDLALVPGVGFDLTGCRLGRGQGFYDRLLAQFGGITCGVAFDQQIVERIPAEIHDARMNFILTPTRWLRSLE